MKVHYNIKQLIAASEYLAENNPYFNHEPEFYAERMLDSIRRYATDPDIWITGTLGYYIRFEQETDDDVYCEIMVQPSFGGDGLYLSEEII